MAETPSPGLTPGANTAADPRKKQRDQIQADAKKYAQQRTTGGSSASAKDPMVFLGFTLSDADRKEARMEGAQAFSELPASAVAAQYYTWDQKTKDKFLLSLGLAGVQNPDQLPDSEIQKLWASYVNQAAAYNTSGVKLTPWDVISKDMKQRETAYQKARTVTTTSTNLDMSSALTARAIFQEASRALLGRAPTKAETKLFQSQLNAYERANPQTTTTTTSYAGGAVGAPGTGEATGQSSTTKGGVTSADRAMMAEDAAKADPEYGAYQAASNGMNWLMEMINGG